MRDDPQSQTPDQDDLFMGKRKAYIAVPERIQLSPQQVSKRSHGFQQLDSKNGPSGQNLPCQYCVSLSSDL